jgi:hypothetical protein
MTFLSGRRGCGACIQGCGTGTLNTSIHVRLVIIADIGDIVSPFKGTTNTEHPNIKCCAVTTDAQDMFVPALPF